MHSLKTGDPSIFCPPPASAEIYEQSLNEVSLFCAEKVPQTCVCSSVQCHCDCADCERGFSCLSAKGIKSSVRNRLNETALMLVFLGGPALRGLNVNRVISAWAREKQHRMHVN